MFIFDSTFKGDDYGKAILVKFLTDFVEKFCGKCFVKEKVLQRVLAKPYRYEDSITSSEMSENDEELVALSKSIAEYGREFLDNVCDARNFVDHYYENEWKKVPLEYNYAISQYNSMLLRDVLKYIAANFIRHQLYEIYKQRAVLYHKKKGNTAYMTCMSGIEEYGIYNPDPRFKGQDKRLHQLTTRQPDVNVLKDFFDKYKLVQWEKDLDESGYHVSRYGGFTSSGCYSLLNTLKYTHMNIGKTKGRRVLDIKSKQVHHKTLLDGNKAVTGYWKHNYTGKHVVGKNVEEHLL